MADIACLIPAHNAEQTIAAAIESACEFDQITVWDDGSTDRTYYLARSYPVKALMSFNRGVQPVRNLLWQSSSAEFIAYLDADDRRIHGALAPQLMAMGHADVIYSPVLRGNKPLRLTADPVATILGTNLQTNGLLFRRSILEKLQQHRGEVWRENAAMRHEYWLLFDLWALGATIAYHPSPVATYEPGRWSARQHIGDRLREYERLVCAVREVFGFRNWKDSEHEAIAVRNLTAMRYRNRKLN